MIRLLARSLPAPFPSPVSKLSLFLSLPACRLSSLPTGKRGEEETIRAKVCPSMHYSILSGQGRSQSQESSRVCKGQGLFLYRLNSGDHIIFRHLYIRLKFSTVYRDHYAMTENHQTLDIYEMIFKDKKESKLLTNKNNKIEFSHSQFKANKKHLAKKIVTTYKMISFKNYEYLKFRDFACR